MAEESGQSKREGDSLFNRKLSRRTFIGAAAATSLTTVGAAGVKGYDYIKQRESDLEDITSIAPELPQAIAALNEGGEHSVELDPEAAKDFLTKMITYNIEQMLKDKRVKIILRGTNSNLSLKDNEGHLNSTTDFGIEYHGIGLGGKLQTSTDFITDMKKDIYLNGYNADASLGDTNGLTRKLLKSILAPGFTIDSLLFDVQRLLENPLHSFSGMVLGMLPTPSRNWA